MVPHFLEFQDQVNPLEINVNIGMSQKCSMLGSQTLRTGARKAYPRHACQNICMS